VSEREQDTETGEMDADSLGQRPGVLLDQQDAPDHDDDGHRRQPAGQELRAQMIRQPFHRSPLSSPGSAARVTGS
jgi:hypothetical protein